MGFREVLRHVEQAEIRYKDLHKAKIDNMNPFNK